VVSPRNFGRLQRSPLPAVPSMILRHFLRYRVIFAIAEDG
jgi:hypothetical protein